MSDSAEPSASKLGPLFVSGRQHSGNTVVSFLLKSMDECYGIDHEGSFFEHRNRLDGLGISIERAQWIAEHLNSRDEEQNQLALDYLPKWAEENPEADALTLYRQMMDHLTAEAGKTFWSQKATAYIYYVDEIFESLPDARMIYMVRNPYDVCASRKRRWPKRERIVGWALSWNKGIQIARECEAKYPDRIHLVKYEELVTNPEPSIRKFCDFIGVPYKDEMLNVPIVNTSEARRQVVESSHGFSGAKVFQYMERLTKTEIAALDMLLSREDVVREYPELPHLSEKASVGKKLAAMGLIAAGPLKFLRDKLHGAKTTAAGPFIERTLKRLRA